MPVHRGLLSLALVAALAACPPQQKPQGEKPKLAKAFSPIINGVVDDLPAHAAVVALQNGADGFFCSGTLITPRVVLTAGHCVKEVSMAGVEVGFGPDVGNATWIPVVETKAHPSYSKSSLANDIGLVRLGKAAPAGIAPIPVLPSSLALKPADTGTVVDFSGFGQNNTEIEEYGIKLHVTDGLDLICETPSGCAFKGDNTPAHTICYDQQPGGPCSGDSGGPAFVTKGGAEYVVGVTSYGDQGCRVSGCSTNATSFEGWIASFVGAYGTKPDGAACAAGSECESSFCTDGVCCNTACNNGGCTACSVAKGAPTDGVCSPITAACDDANACTAGDHCEGGRCIGTVRDCPPLDGCHFYAVCDPATGACGEYPNRPDGTACDDADECTVEDRCQQGACTGDARATCPAPSACLRPAICADKKCGAYAPKVNGEACDDGDGCTLDETCQNGACQPADAVRCPPTPCHGWGRCDPSTGQCIPGVTIADGLSCDDGSACTTGETCLAGECLGTVVTGACAAQQCRAAGTCQADGTCDGAPLPDGTACDDGDGCTRADACEGGACVAGRKLDCRPPDACKLGSACDHATGKCAWSPAPAGTACDDHDLCTRGDTCSGIDCVGVRKECDPPPECSFPGLCNARTGTCEYTWQPDGTECSRGACEAGACRAKGCGCSTGGEPASVLLALLAFAGIARRRRG